MEAINRRDMLIGSGLALTLAGCSDSNTEDRSRTSRQILNGGPFEDDWNYGDAPWLPHPTYPNTHFDPAYVAILYLELTHAGISTKRVHFRCPQGVGNDWASIQSKVVSFLNYLNRATIFSPGTHHTFPGLKDFAFNQPHHLVIYIKNRGVDYRSAREIWFGKQLIGEILGVDQASMNQSFFGATRFSDTRLRIGSQNLVYVKNYYHIRDDSNTYRPIGEEEVAYSLKINALIPSVEDPSVMIPLLIDPDTGNMGGGQPFTDT